MLNQNDKSHKHTQIVVAMTALGCALALIPALTHANDFQIYQKPTAGKKTLIMMLDTSGSMGYGDRYGTSVGSMSILSDYNICSAQSSVLHDTTTATYSRDYCTVAYSTDASSDYVRLKNQCEVQPSNGGLRCYTRLTRLQDGMFAVLNSTEPRLNSVVMGVGNFSAKGDGRSGQILVAAQALGAAGSTQRTALKTAIAGLTAYNGTPTAHGYADAAAYLMGTSTYSETDNSNNVKVDRYRLIKTYTVGAKLGSTYPYTYTYALSTCITQAPSNFTSNTQGCTTWGTPNTSTGSNTDPSSSNPTWAGSPTIPSNDGSGSSTSGKTTTITYYVTQSQISTTTDTNSGVPNSKSNSTSSNPIVVDNTVSNLNALYQSPLPSVANRVSCDGQGIYVLSDGQPNSSSSAKSEAVMSKALTVTYSAGTNAFSCPTSGGLPLTASDSAWNCMGEFSKRLYDPTKNPSGVSIKTAFVGFGIDFGSIATANNTSDVVNACRLGSNLTTDTCAPQDPTAPTNSKANPAGGYGNGGFYVAGSPDDVTNSVINFIDNLGNQAITPLVTGSATVPIDSLNPNGFQSFGYLRMLEPNPAQPSVLLWRGNVKKYRLSSGAMVSGSTGTTAILNSSGVLASGTTDLWNASTGDGGIIDQGGAYSKVPVPSAGGGAANIRRLYTDVGTVTSGTLNGLTNGADLTSISGSVTTPSTDIPAMFKATGGTSPMKDMSLLQQKALINYLGYNLPLDATAIPTTLTAPTTPYFAMGGSVHAQPVQVTYSATLNAKTGAIGTRKESLLYGSMEGALHLVDATSGVEQMAFIPKEILGNTIASSTLHVGQQDASASPATPNQGVDGPWVIDAAYKSSRSDSKLVASTLKAYGGLRMGGNSYYGLDLLGIFTSTASVPVAPKLLFRVDSSTTGFSRIGQSWSKPVLANIRYQGKIKRVMIVGGGYDTNYESPTYVPTGAAPAMGNTVYMISVDNADAGTLIWSASNSNMIHSVVSHVATLDRDADGLVDCIYYADLGGKVFRADFNNAYNTTASNFPVRVVLLANLGTDASGSALTGGKNPRFYEAPTVTIHDQGSKTFALIGLASGDRSSPLDIITAQYGGAGLTDRLVNNVYGIIDRDVARTDFIKLNSTATAYVNTNGTSYSSITHDLTLANLQKDPQVNLTGVVADTFFPTDSTVVAKAGWYRSLSSVTSSTGTLTELGNGTVRKAGGMKAFEEPNAITGKLYVTVYDPEGTGVPQANPCAPRVVGETDVQKYCLPYGVCTISGTGTDSGKRDTSANALTGFQVTGVGTVADPYKNDVDKVLGAGIRGLVLGDKGDTPTGASCQNITLIGNNSGTGSWSCTRKLVQTMWYEKKPNPALVK